MRIPFSKQPCTERSLEYVRSVIESGLTSGDFAFSERCHEWLEARTGSPKALLTPSGTDALEMAALLLGIGPGDEVIMPSFTFSSTANAFLLRGARIKFIDIRPDTLNLDETLIEAAVTEKTKAIVPVHYAGVACEMDAIWEVAGRHGIAIVEDAAQALMSEYKGRMLGSIGDFGCYSFHATKNFSSGEGGAILVNRPEYVQRAEIVREKGTNRSQFFRGQVDKYTWRDVGSSYLMSDINAALLFSQLEMAEEMLQARRSVWNFYLESLNDLQEEGRLRLPLIPAGAENHNAHIFYLVTGGSAERDALLSHMTSSGVHASFHYVPLHSSPAGIEHGDFVGTDQYTTLLSGRMLRLPIFFGMAENEADFVVHIVNEFFQRNRN